jgi:hypothetical protein
MESNTTSSSTEQNINPLLNLATESWRFSKMFYRVTTKLDAGEQNRYVSQYRYFIKQLEETLTSAGYSLVNLEGQLFDPGMAATPLNIEDFEPEDELFVEQMLEPVIMNNNGLVRMGTVTLRKVG